MTNSINIRRVQLEKNFLSSSYNKTDSNKLDGTHSTLNLILNSEFYNGSTWLKQNLTSLSYNTSTNPFGGKKCVKISTFDQGGFEGNIVSFLSNTKYTLSCYVKYVSGPGIFKLAITSDSIFGNIGGERYLEFNLNTGLIENHSIEMSSFYVEELNNSWYRVSATFTASSAGTSSCKFLLKYGGSSAIFYGFMLEVGDYVSQYCPTNENSVLMQPGSNYFEFSEEFDQVHWTKNNSIVKGNIKIISDDKLSSYTDNLIVYDNIPLIYFGNTKLVIGEDTNFKYEICDAGDMSKTSEFYFEIFDKTNNYKNTKTVSEVFSNTSLLLNDYYFNGSLENGFYKVTKNRFSEKNIDYNFKYYQFVYGTIKIENNIVTGYGTKFTQQLVPGGYIVVTYNDLNVFLDDGALSAIKTSSDYFQVDMLPSTSFKLEVLTVVDDNQLILKNDSKISMLDSDAISYGIEDPLIS